MMMNKQRLFAASRAAAALSVVGLLALSACGERPYPAQTHEAPPAAAPSAELMGAPQTASPYTAPPVYSQPAYASPYDSGAVVAMAPIPNPGDPGSGPYYTGRGRVHARFYVAPRRMAQSASNSPYGEGHPAPGRHPVYAPSPVAAAPRTVASKKVTSKTAAPSQTAQAVKAPTTTTTTKTTTTAKAVTHKAAAIVAATGAAAGALALNAQHAVATKPTTPSVAKPGAAPTATTPAPAADRTTRLAALQTTLTDAVGKTAVLSAPATFTANKPTDVTLTLPAAFGDTVKDTAQKQDLADAAASVAMTALLSGDGFAVTPDDTQSAQLALGQPTAFHWTATAQAGAKGPLHADVGADLLGGGSEKLALGSVQPAGASGSKLTPRFIGGALLVLLAALVLAWLARGRGPVRSAEGRRASRMAQGSRPLDMSAPPADDRVP